MISWILDAGAGGGTAAGEIMTASKGQFADGIMCAEEQLRRVTAALRTLEHIVLRAGYRKAAATAAAVYQPVPCGI